MRCNIQGTTARHVHRCGLGLIVVAGLGPVSALASGPSRPEKRHAEHHRFDAETGQWIPVTQPVAGTEDGDLDIARQWMAREDYDTAEEVLEDWFDGYGSASDRYPEALYLKATCYLQRGYYRKALGSYTSLLDDFPGSPFAERALSGMFRVGEAYLAGKRRRAWGGLLRIKDHDSGLEIMDDLVANYPDTPLAEMAQMAKADYHYNAGDFELAELAYATFARDYPKSRWHARSQLRSAESALASFPGVRFDDAALNQARERYVQFRRQYPGSAEQLDVAGTLNQIDASRADKRRVVAEYYERVDQPEAARIYYRTLIDRWPETPAASQARARLAALSGVFGEIESDEKSVSEEDRG